MEAPDEAVYRLHARILKALAQPRRLMILDYLHSGPKTVGEIVDGLALPQANVSQHLAAMRAEELVTTRREGNTVYYSLVSNTVVEACDLFHRFLQERLQANQALASQLPASRPLRAPGARLVAAAEPAPGAGQVATPGRVAMVGPRGRHAG